MKGSIVGEKEKQLTTDWSSSAAEVKAGFLTFLNMIAFSKRLLHLHTTQSATEIEPQRKPLSFIYWFRILPVGALIMTKMVAIVFQEGIFENPPLVFNLKSIQNIFFVTSKSRYYKGWIWVSLLFLVLHKTWSYKMHEKVSLTVESSTSRQTKELQQ